MEILSETSLNPAVKLRLWSYRTSTVNSWFWWTSRGFKTLNPEQEYVTISMGKVGMSHVLLSDVIGILAGL